MAVSLLLIIYLIFISLGLPDSMLGSIFPAIADNLSISKDISGYIGITVSCFTIISSLFSEKLIKKFKTGKVVSFSILLTALGLLLFSFVREQYWCFFLCAIPLGLGAGAIDSALNNYVALNYKPIHMNWLHCSWGVGASIGPMIMSAFIDSANQSSGWYNGILAIFFVQLAICLISFITLPLWNKVANKEKLDIDNKSIEEEPQAETKSLFKNPIFYLSIVGIFCYCALETTTGVWSGFFFNQGKGFSTADAARLSAMFYIGITIGRFISGPLSLKIKEINMIRMGESLLIVGLILALLPGSVYFSVVGFAFIGLGCAPIYPAIISLTPYRFSKAMSQKVMGLQMACAYCGNVLISPFYGLVAKNLDNYLFLPWVVLVLALGMVVCHEIINIKLTLRDKNLTDEEKKQYLIR
ncbi:MAG: MFS transporter [Bacilli bacterium]